MSQTILIVDDSPVNRRILQRILSDHYTTLQAENGQQALELARQTGSRLSAVLLDLVMPVMDGLAFLKRIRAIPEFATLPVIVTTGQTDEDTEVQALRCGASDFLGKPYRPQIILARLETLIRLRETAALINRVERDSLTGLLNQEGFYERAGRVLAQRPMDLLVMDICNFKLVNDLYGDQAGDQLLRSIAGQLRREVTAPGSLLARKTGDQFLALIPPDPAAPEALWQRLNRWLTDYPLDMNLPVRVGAYHAENDALPVSVMCDNAKLAADSIRGRFDVRTAVYDVSMRTELRKNQELVKELEQGLAEGQFEAWYQPKCDPVTGRITGAEALVRWRHPERGIVPPDRFIPLMERSRLIVQLDRHMWEMVCRDLTRWSAEGRPVVPVSVNVSRVDVYDRNLAHKLEELARQYGLDPRLLPLEITESAYADDPAQLLAAVRDLHRRGFPIEMDDFGSGYSSLNMLAELPVDGVKLDIRFLQRFRQKSRSGELVRHLMELLDCLGLHVTAEGVETREQLFFLRELRCPMVQGRYYADALPPAEFEAFLLAHQ